MAYVKLKKNEDFSSLLRRFKRQLQDEGLVQELKKREYYLSPSQKRREKSKAAQARLRRQQRKIKIVEEE